MTDLRRLVQQRTSNSALLNWGDIETAPISAKEIRHWLIEYQGELKTMCELTGDWFAHPWLNTFHSLSSKHSCLSGLRPKLGNKNN